MNNIKKTLFAVLVGRGVMAARQLIVIPFLITAWGIEYYGEWLIISSIPAFLTMSNLGMGTSASTKIALRDTDLTRENRVTFSTSWIIILFAGTILTLLSFIWQKYNGSSSKIEYKPYVVGLLVATVFLKMLFQPLQGWWVSTGLPSKGIHLNNTLSIIELFISIILPILKQDALVMAASLLIANILWLLISIIVCQKNKCDIISLRSFSYSESTDLLKTGIGHQLSPLWQAILFQGSILIAGKLLGPAGAAMWGSLRVVNRVGNQSLELISQSLGPQFQKNSSVGNKLANRQLHAKGAIISLLLAALICIWLNIFGSKIFNLWTHSKFNVPYFVWLIMPLSLLPFSLWWLSGELLRSLNKPWYLNIVGIGSACVSILATLIFKNWGIVGLCIGSLIFEFLMMILILPKALRVLYNQNDTMPVVISLFWGDLLTSIKGRSFKNMKTKIVK